MYHGWETLKTERPVHPTLLELKQNYAIGGTTGKVIRAPTRIDMAMDQIFYGMSYERELHGLATRQAQLEKLSGSRFDARVRQILDQPPEALMDAAIKEAKQYVFQKDPGVFTKAAIQVLNEHPEARFIVPFVRTPVNVFKAFAEHTPAGLLMREVRDNLKGANGSVARDRQIAKLGIGGGIALAAYWMAENEVITGGGPTDPDERARKMAEGWMPYSVRIGDTLYSYRRWSEPYGLVLGVMADLTDIKHAVDKEEYDKIAGLMVAAISKNLVATTALKGPSDLARAIADADRNFDRVLNNFVASLLIPAGVAQFARYDDPYMREVRTMIDALKARIPGKSDEVEPRIDYRGLPLERWKGAGPDLLSPIKMSELAQSPVFKEMEFLQMWPARVDRRIGNVELEPAEYTMYQASANSLTWQALSEWIESPGWSQLGVGQRREVLAKVIMRARRLARIETKMMNPRLVQAGIEFKLNEIQGVTIKGKPVWQR